APRPRGVRPQRERLGLLRRPRREFQPQNQERRAEPGADWPRRLTNRLQNQQSRPCRPPAVRYARPGAALAPRAPFAALSPRPRVASLAPRPRLAVLAPRL